MTDTQTMTTPTDVVLSENAYAQLANLALFAGNDASRPILTHILIEVSDDGVRGVSTDTVALCIEERIGSTFDRWAAVKPLDGHAFDDDATVWIERNDWHVWQVIRDYGNWGVWVHTAGDPTVTMIYDHGDMAPYDDDGPWFTD